jgi:hypothetical protein
MGRLSFARSMGPGCCHDLGTTLRLLWSIPGFMHTWFCVTQLRQVALL